MSRRKQQNDYRRSLENQIKLQQNSYLGLKDNLQKEDQVMHKNEWNDEQNKVFNERLGLESKRQREKENLIESMQNAQIQKQRNFDIKNTENETIK